MSASMRIRARSPRGELVLPTRRDEVEDWLLDAAYSPGGHAEAGFLPSTEAHVAAVLRAHETVLVVGAQSSLTGGATPAGGVVLATERLDAMRVDAEGRFAVCGAGVSLRLLQDAARDHGLFVAPAPTYDGAFVGGSVATNAAGAATFKHGTMRAAVRALTVVLASGDVLDIRRGEVLATDGVFEIEGTDGSVARVVVPSYRAPDVPKCSAGYEAADAMDLIDLFVGSEGTLGVITEVELDLAPLPASSLTCWLPFVDEAAGIGIARALRDASITTWREHDPRGIDVRSIEHVGTHSIDLLIADGEDRKQGMPLESGDALALFFTLDLARPVSADTAVDRLSGEDEADGPLTRLLALLGEHADRLEVALPGEERQAARFAALREAVPMAVNHRVRDVFQTDPRVHKVAADFVVPFDVFEEAMHMYRSAFAARGLDYAIWGHISDGNVHPNVIPRGWDDVVAGKEVLLELAQWVVERGGSPLAEHGVGRNPVKQEMLRLLRGDSGVREMQAVKAALDPDWKLAPGVLFPRPDDADGA